MNVAIHVYRAMREVVQAMDDVLPGKFEITRAGIVHDMIAPDGPHELTRLWLRKRLEKTMPMEIVAHTGRPDVEDESAGIMRRPDVVVTAWADMDIPGSFDPRTSSPPSRSSPVPTRTTTGWARSATIP